MLSIVFFFLNLELWIFYFNLLYIQLLIFRYCLFIEEILLWMKTISKH